MLGAIAIVNDRVGHWSLGVPIAFSQLKPYHLRGIALQFCTMAETQLDSASLENPTLQPEIDWSLGSLPVAEEKPPAKRARLEIHKDTSRDRIKWVATADGKGAVPFVRDADTSIVHSGTSKMEVTKVGSATRVQCLSGCSAECDMSCHCFCHLLRAYYIERQEVHGY